MLFIRILLFAIATGLPYHSDDMKQPYKNNQRPQCQIAPLYLFRISAHSLIGSILLFSLKFSSLIFKVVYLSSSHIYFASEVIASQTSPTHWSAEEPVIATPLLILQNVIVLRPSLYEKKLG